jgi:hypothetical protein
MLRNPCKASQIRVESSLERRTGVAGDLSIFRIFEEIGKYLNGRTADIEPVRDIFQLVCNDASRDFDLGHTHGEQRLPHFDRREYG